MYWLKVPISQSQMMSHIERSVIVDDPKVIPHMAQLLSSIHSKGYAHAGVIHLSNTIKQSNPPILMGRTSFPRQLPLPVYANSHRTGNKEVVVKNYSIESQKLQWAGINLGNQITYIIQHQLNAVAEKFRAREVRFWGKIFAINHDYYVIQGVRETPKSIDESPKGAQKNGEGINYYTFWVTNSVLHPEWIELPYITPSHIKVARQIKKAFTGHLDNHIESYPSFAGQQKHYLKAQLVRMTASLELVPKGVYKASDDNPKIIELQDQIKVPEFAELNALENWVHKNQNILTTLGRCTHYIDPLLPQAEIEAVTTELAEKDPEVERLRAATEDKVPESLNLGIQNIWQVRVQGDSQVFNKDEAQLVYGVVVLKNIYWPGWVNIGYKNGFSSVYLGNGHKSLQPAWRQYENANLVQEAEDVNECYEPNPKELPKAPEQVPVAEPEGDID